MFSIIIPMDPNRLEQFKITKLAYDLMPQDKEFVILTRNELAIKKYINEHDLRRDVRVIPYTVEVGFNCSKALNLGVRNAKYNSIIITSPEVKPITPVLDQLEKVLGSNVICQVFDEDEHHKIAKSLVHTGYRDESPRMYFLAMFNKADIEKINGWDEDFMKGYASEDYDFGARWARAKIPFVMIDDIQGVHQYHPRGETIPGGTDINKQKFKENNAAEIIRCTNGLVKL
jgi:hypothetical protein